MSAQLATQLGQHRRAVRAHPAPDAEGLGGLLHQHAQAVDAARRAMFGSPAIERGRLLAVHHVVAHRVAGLDQARVSVDTSAAEGEVSVTVAFRDGTDVPLVGGVLPDVTLTSTATMRREQQES